MVWGVENTVPALGFVQHSRKRVVAGGGAERGFLTIESGGITDSSPLQGGYDHD